MKTIRARNLALLVAIVCFAPALAVAKPSAAPLPDRNPERPAQTAEQVTPETAPASQEAMPAATETTQVGTAAVETAPPGGAPPEGAPTKTPSATIEAASPETTTSDATASVAKSSEAAPSEPAPGTTTVAAIPPPVRNPEKPAPEPAAQAEETDEPESAPLVDVSLPEINPNRASPMSPPAPEPALDYASVLKPLLNYNMSSADESRLRFIMRHKGSIEETAAKISDPAVRAFGLWYRYKHNKSTVLKAEAIEEFRLAHPYWPSQDDLREKAETSLFLTEADPDRIKAFFGPSAPQTGAGKAAMARVYLKEDNEAAAKDLVVSAWRDHTVNQTVEKKILSKYGKMLSHEHHRARIDKLLYPDRKSATKHALRVAKLLPASEQKKVAARIAVIKRGGNAGKLLDALPDGAIEADVGLRFNNIQWLRRTKNKEKRLRAWKLLLDAPLEQTILLDLKEWWIERRINVRAAMNDGHPRTAYEIAAKHGLNSGDSYIEAEYLAGWIALRYLDEPNTALRHFLTMRKAAETSRYISMAEYWLGRTALVLGDRSSATVHFHGAAKYPQYFYGQLGRQALDPRPARLEVTSTPTPTQADIDRFMAREGVRAIGIARAAKLEWVTPQFFLALSRKLDSAAEVVLLAELAKATNKRQIGLRLSKIAFNRDLPLGDYALPIGVMPAFKSLLSKRVDPALVHALSRQESEFNAGAKSPVGASGLMQLMPATARGVARRYKVKYSKSRLTNAAYNQQLGEAFLHALIEGYDGSYFLALAAYNAGPGRVKEWMGIYGDPRNPDVDPIDWMERIPFTETRRYVFKIMETLQLYRSRLSGPNGALHLVQDLNRGRRVPPSETATVAELPVAQASASKSP